MNSGRIKVVEIRLENGEFVRVPFLDLIEARMSDKMKVFAGRTYDIFSAPRQKRFPRDEHHGSAAVVRV
ncbi:hypothetical protein [Staphylospora marina]|uniref:hypothetical protein n=1 Tax=Staphylospora marina TaxID=2490858 RepID=UPI000F5BE8E0|nr:hypothetical protein [Staphylospora marina]